MLARLHSPGLPARGTIFYGLPAPNHAPAQHVAARARSQLLRAVPDSVAPPVLPLRSHSRRWPQQRTAAATTCLRWRARCAQRPRLPWAQMVRARGIPLVLLLDVARASPRPPSWAVPKADQRRRCFPALLRLDARVDGVRPRPDTRRRGSARQAPASRPASGARDRPDTTSLPQRRRSRSARRPRRGRAHGARAAMAPRAASPAERSLPPSENFVRLL